MADIIVKVKDGLGCVDSIKNADNSVDVSDNLNVGLNFKNVSDIQINLTENFNINSNNVSSNETSYYGEDEIKFSTQYSDELKNSSYSVSDNVRLMSSIISDLDVSISSPLDGTEFTQGNDIHFFVLAQENGDDVNNGDIHWISSINGEFNTGNDFTYSALAVGVHEITIKVGEYIETPAINITIVKNSKPNRPNVLTEE